MENKFNINEKVDYLGLPAIIMGIKINPIDKHVSYYLDLGQGNQPTWADQEVIRKWCIAISECIKHIIRNLLKYYRLKKDTIYVDSSNTMYIETINGTISLPIGQHRLEYYLSYKLEDLGI